MRALKRFLRRAGGVAAIEFALILPLLLLLALGSVEAARYALLRMKVANAATLAADFATRLNTARPETVDAMLGAAMRVAEPIDQAALRIILTSVSGPSADDAVIGWTRAAGGATGFASRIGVGPGDVAPPGLLTNAHPNVIVVETMFAYAPLVSSDILSHTIYEVAWRRPRRADLSALE